MKTLNRPIEELLSNDISRSDMSYVEEEAFVNHWFDKFESAGFAARFRTPYSDYTAYNGKPFTVLSRATVEDLDLDALPMWKIRFEDGTETIAYPEEICNRRADDCPQGPTHGCPIESLLESSEKEHPCATCEKATTIDGTVFACTKRIAALMTADIGNGAHTAVAGTEDQDKASRYFKLAHNNDLSIVVCLIYRVAAPNFNSAPYYELHFVDNITEPDCEIIPVPEMTVECVSSELESLIRQFAQRIYNAKRNTSPIKYLVQCKYPDGETSVGLFTEQQIIDMHGFRDCSDCEYEVYDIRAYGRVIKLEERCDSCGEPNYHRFCYPKELGGDTVFSGYSPEH